MVKLKEKALGLNYKRAFAILAVAALLAAAAGAVCLAVNAAQAERELDRNGFADDGMILVQTRDGAVVARRAACMGGDFGDDFLSSIMSPADLAVLGISGVVLGLCFALWRVLISLWTWKAGDGARMPGGVWAVAALVCGLPALVIFLLAMALTRRKCRSCGARTLKEKYCSECGAANTVTCSACGEEVSIGGKYCPKCGHGLEDGE